MNVRILGLASLCCFLFPPALLAQNRYDTIVKQMENIAQKHSDKAETFVLGKNDQGEDIRGLRVGEEGTGNPAMLLVAAHHGDEVDSVDVALRFVTDLLQPGSGERLQDAVFYVVPVLNVSGYNRVRREESSRHGGTLDPNRDYADPCRKDAPHRLESTRLLADFVARQNIVAAVSIHGYIGTFTFPWGTYTTESRTSDHDTYESMAQRAVAHNGYHIGTHNDLIYPTIGAFDDWAYHAHGIWTMLLEVSSDLDVAKDARAVTEFFALSPRQRSTQHTHAGTCKDISLEDVRSRP